MAEGKGAAPPRGSVPAPVPSPRAAIGSAKGGSGSVPGRGVRDGASPCHARGSAGRCGIGAVCPHFGPVGGGGPPAELLRRPGVSSEGLSGASCGARTARTCPGAPGGRAALRCGRTAVPPPSERGQPGESCCHRAGLRSALRAKTCGDETGRPGKGAAAAPHACLQRPKRSFSFSTVSARFLLAQMCAGVARSSAPGRRGGGDKDEDLPALCPHCRTPYGPSALHPHAVLQHCARLAWHGVLFCSGNAALWVSNSHPMLPRDGSEITAAERHSWGELSEASTAPATPRPGCC